MKVLVFCLILALAVAVCSADLIEKIIGEPCNFAQKALCSSKCLFDSNRVCIKSDDSLGYTCTCIDI